MCRSEVLAPFGPGNGLGSVRVTVRAKRMDFLGRSGKSGLSKLSAGETEHSKGRERTIGVASAMLNARTSRTGRTGAAAPASPGMGVMPAHPAFLLPKKESQTADRAPQLPPLADLTLLRLQT